MPIDAANADASMFRRLRFIRRLAAGEWIAILLAGVSLGLLLAWVRKRFQIDPRVFDMVLMMAAGVLLSWCVLLLVAYVKELRREEDEWAGRDEEDAG